mmetsp:Transcript_82744/g.267961  ORF Transcript_82744/g.267961 Transcript_82744/m.267961 type:complete len:206 (+) Transcript_82744:735-1352(+)
MLPTKKSARNIGAPTAWAKCSAASAISGMWCAKRATAFSKPGFCPGCSWSASHWSASLSSVAPGAACRVSHAFRCGWSTPNHHVPTRALPNKVSTRNSSGALKPIVARYFGCAKYPGLSERRASLSCSLARVAIHFVNPASKLWTVLATCSGLIARTHITPSPLLRCAGLTTASDPSAVHIRSSKKRVTSRLMSEASCTSSRSGI